jgi:hypothetical protein
MNDFLKEIQNEMATEKYQAIFIKHGAKLIIAAITIVALTAGYKIYSNVKYNRSVELGSQLISSIDSPDASAFDPIIAKQHKGYSPIAGLIKAGNLSAETKTDDAIKALQQVAAENGNDAAFREIAQINEAVLMIQKNDSKEKILELLDKTSAQDSIFRSTALEIKANYLLANGDSKQAKEILSGLAADKSIPATIQDRAKHVLSTIK